jgi:SAM-dependent methyltransferase
MINSLDKLYTVRFPKKFLPRKNEIWKIICRFFLQKYISQHSIVIDVACGYGEFINNIKASKKIAIDLNPDAKNYLKSDVEFKLIKALSLSLIGKKRGEVVDVVFTSNFLEHLPDKNMLDAFLDQVKVVLKPNGKYIILGPNLRYLPGQYWDFYDHHLGLTHLSLCEALKLKGFKIEVCIDKFLPYTTQGSLPTHPFFVWLYLHLPFLWKIFGKQFFIVARKVK